MASKIVDDSLPVQPFSWPTAAAPQRALSPALQPEPEPSNGEAALRQQLAEIEQARPRQLEQATRQAFEEGRQKGYGEAASEIEIANDRLAKCLRDLPEMKRRLRHQAETDLVKLSLAIARRILHRELNTDEESIQGLVHAGLEKLQNREVSTVRVAPEAVGSVRSALEKAAAYPAISITPDPRMRAGDLIFETALGDLDASVETQLREIERGFVDRLGSA